VDCFRGLPRLANEIPLASAALRSSPAFFKASIFSGPLRIDRAASRASSAKASKSLLEGVSLTINSETKPLGDSQSPNTVSQAKFHAHGRHRSLALVLESRDFTIALPKLDVMPVDQPLGALNCVFFFFEGQINAIDHVTIRADDIGVEPVHWLPALLCGPGLLVGFQILSQLPVLDREFFVFLLGMLVSGQIGDQRALRCAAFQ
jgi:hypothetical protein